MTASQIPPGVDAGPPAVDAAVPRHRSRLLDSVVEIATTVILAIVLYLVIQTFVVQTYRVEQVSMLPTLREDQHLLIDKLTPRFDSYSRGDIVVFHAPDTEPGSTPYIKRVIGVAGDEVSLRDGSVFVNGVQLDEPYVSGDGGGITDPQEGGESWAVGEGQVFVMGDHRNRSVDSRSFGVVDVDDVIGRAWLRFWPLDTLGILQTPTYPDIPADPALVSDPDGPADAPTATEAP